MDSGIPTQSVAAQGRRVLEGLKATEKLSEDGSKWLTFSLDPFHDKPITGVTGIPDGNTGRSVVCSVVQEKTIKKPGSMPAGNWSVRITTMPVASVQNLNNCKVFGHLVNQVDTGPNLVAPVVIDFALDGTPFATFSLGADFLSIPNAYLKGPFKIGAMAIEIVNTTAEIYRQGLFSGARMNQCSNAAFTAQMFAGAATSWTPITLFPVRTPPVTLEELILLPDVCQWTALEGAYGVVPLKEIGTRSALAHPRFPLVVDSDFQPGVLTVLDGAAPILTAASIPGFGFATPVYQETGYPGEIPMDSLVYMFTGLSEQTTLTLRCRWMIERYPNDQEPEIVVLATPTAAFDPVALEIYSRIINQMPAAVMFKENPAGEWFKRILGAIADVAGPMLVALPHPLAKAAGAALMTGNKVLNPETATRKAVIKQGQVTSVKRNAAKKKKKQQTISGTMPRVPLRGPS